MFDASETSLRLVKHDKVLFDVRNWTQSGSYVLNTTKNLQGEEVILLKVFFRVLGHDMVVIRVISITGGLSAFPLPLSVQTCNEQPVF